MFVVDVTNEETAVREANILKIPIIAIVDTNCDPDPVDHIIPSNDDAIRAIKLIVGKMADAALEGINMRKEENDAEITDFDSYGAEAAYDGVEDADDEQLLGASTLAKIREAEPVVEEAVVEEVIEEVIEEVVVEETVAEVVEEETVGADEENE